MSQNDFFPVATIALEIEGLEDSSFLYRTFIGEPIEVKFRAQQSILQRIGLACHKVAHTSFSRYRTLVSSNNRWDWTGPEEQGTIVFSKEKLL